MFIGILDFLFCQLTYILHIWTFLRYNLHVIKFSIILCNSGVFSVFADLCNHYYYLIPEHLITPEGNSICIYIFVICLSGFFMAHDI